MLPPWDVIAKLSVGRTVIKGGKTQAHCTHNPEKSATAAEGKSPSSLFPLRENSSAGGDWSQKEEDSDPSNVFCSPSENLAHRLPLTGLSLHHTMLSSSLLFPQRLAHSNAYVSGER